MSAALFLLACFIAGVSSVLTGGHPANVVLMSFAIFVLSIYFEEKNHA